MCLVKWFVGWVFLQILWRILSYAKPWGVTGPFFCEILGEELHTVFIGVSQMSNDCNLVNYDVYIMYSTYWFLIVETTTVTSAESALPVQTPFFLI